MSSMVAGVKPKVFLQFSPRSKNGQKNTTYGARYRIYATSGKYSLVKGVRYGYDMVVFEYFMYCVNNCEFCQFCFVSELTFCVLSMHHGCMDVCSCLMELAIICTSFAYDSGTDVSEKQKTLEIMRKFSEQYAKR